MTAGSTPAPSAGEQVALLEVPRMSRNTHIRKSQERFICNAGDLHTVAVLRFRVRDEPLQRNAQRFLLIKPKNRGLDLPSHEEEGQTCFMSRRIESGTSIFDRCPSIRMRFPLELERGRQTDTFFNQNA